MGWGAGILGAAAAAWAWKRLVLWRYPVDTHPDEVHYFSADDGWRLALCRYRPAAVPRRHPVVICHGLGSSHFIFDLLPRVSLARFLAARGFDVWLLDLRGHGWSERPRHFEGRGYDWNFDDYLRRDLPAAIDHVLAHAAGGPGPDPAVQRGPLGGPPLERDVSESLNGPSCVHWIGHSMGGLLLYAHLASSPEPRLRSGTALGSSLDYTSSSSGFHRLLKAQRIAEFVPAFPLGLFALYLAPLTGWVPNPMERFNVWSPNVDAATLRRLMANGYSAVPGSLLRQLASAIQPGGLRSSDGRVAYLEGLANVHTPVLAIAGDHDRQCPPAAARVPLDALGSSERRLEVFGTASGHAEHYGHSDLIIGRRAYLEVYPVVAQWLEAQD